MNWQKYTYELLLAGSLLFLLIGYGYRGSQFASLEQNKASLGRSADELKEIIALKKIWSDPRVEEKVKKIETLISPDKVKWSKTSQKITATYHALSPQELNTLVNKILNLPVQIQQFSVKKAGTSYDVEFQCKW